VTPELAWGEGDYTHNLTIENNTIRSVCTGAQVRKSSLKGNARSNANT
jgi:hypothetical protein